jgi:hypothetical protein
MYSKEDRLWIERENREKFDLGGRGMGEVNVRELDRNESFGCCRGGNYTGFDRTRYGCCRGDCAESVRWKGDRGGGNFSGGLLLFEMSSSKKLIALKLTADKLAEVASVAKDLTVKKTWWKYTQRAQQETLIRFRELWR